MFASVALARRIEQAAAVDLGRAAERSGGFTIPVGQGTAIFAGPDSPLTKVVGLDIDVSGLAAVEARFGEHAAAVTVELPSLAEPGLLQALAEAGYRPTSFEEVLGRATSEQTPRTEAVLRESPDAELEAWLDVLVEGFAHPDEEGPQTDEEFPREAVRDAVRSMTATSTRVLALREGTPAAAGSLSIVRGVAFFSGAATLPAHRRRGLQTAMLEHRLALAHERGADVACITTAPGSRSKQNAQRRGFVPLYTRLLMTKAPAEV